MATASDDETLAFHLISEHGDWLALRGTPARNVEQHMLCHLISASHEGASTHYDDKKVEAALEYVESHCDRFPE